MALNAPYTPNTVIQSTQVSNDLVGLSNGTNDTTNNSMATYRSDVVLDFVASGCVWSGDSYNSTRNGSLTSGVVYIAGVRLTVGSLSAHLFTALKDTYTDVNGSGVVVFTEVSNNAASPVLAAGSIRIGIIITGASSIVNSGSVNQGQETMVLPIASSIAYSVTDSLGNLICCRDPNHTTLGYRQSTSAFTTTTTGSWVAVTGLSVPFIMPNSNRKIKITAQGANLNMSGGAPGYRQFGVLESSTVLAEADQSNSANFHTAAFCTGEPAAVSSGLHTYVMNVQQNSAGTMTLNPSPAIFLKVELV